MSDSVRSHRRPPTRLPGPWDSPGKNTGVGCHFLLQCMKVKSESEVTQSCPTLSDPMDCGPPGSSIHGIFQARVLEWGAIAFSMRWLWLPSNFSPSDKEITNKMRNPKGQRETKNNFYLFSVTITCKSKSIYNHKFRHMFCWKKPGTRFGKRAVSTT